MSEDKNIDEAGMLQEMHPLTFAAMLDNDTPNFLQATNGPELEQFYKAMEQEMEMLELLMDPWDVVPWSKTQGSNVLDTTWAF